MKILDLDMDYFMNKVAYEIDEYNNERLTEKHYIDSVWAEAQVRHFLENNLGLSKERKIKGRIVVGHNESLEFWKELISNKQLEVPLTVIPTIEDVSFNGDFDFAVLAQSPNYTPTNADFIMDIFKEYITEC